MKILAIDVSVTGCAVCVLDTETGRDLVRRVDADRGQAEMLAPMVGDSVAEAGLVFADLDCIAVTRGPGSFTGVRIGLAMARSLGLALDIPVIGLSTLDVIARERGDSSALYLVDTKRGDFYGQIGEEGGAGIWNEADILAFTGNIIKDEVPDPLILAKMAMELSGGEKGYSVSAAPEPLYLRGAEVSQPKKKAPDIFCNLQK